MSFPRERREKRPVFKVTIATYAKVIRDPCIIKSEGLKALPAFDDCARTARSRVQDTEAHCVKLRQVQYPGTLHRYGGPF